MAKGKTRERRQVRMREAIVQAAEEIVEAQGAEALNMRDVADRIDYSASNLYEYFSSKDELLAAVIEEVLIRLMMHVRSIPADLSAHERLLAYGHMYLEFARVHPQLYLLVFGRKAAEVKSTSLEEENPYSLLQQIIGEGLANGLFISRPGFGLHEMTFGCWSLVHGIAMLRLTTHSMLSEASREHDDQILETFANGMSAH